MRRALELEPLSIPCNLGVGWSLSARQVEEAVAQYRKTLEISPDLPMALYELGLCYQNMRRYDEALAAFQKGHEMSRGEAASVMLLAHLHALNGRYQRRRAVIWRRSKRWRRKRTSHRCTWHSSTSATAIPIEPSRGSNEPTRSVQAT